MASNPKNSQNKMPNSTGRSDRYNPVTGPANQYSPGPGKQSPGKPTDHTRVRHVDNTHESLKKPKGK